METRNEKIAKLAGLLSGKLSKDEFKTNHISIMIGYSEENQYLIEGKEVDRDAWDKVNSKQKSNGFVISYEND